jgi:nicotinamidase-related amidase
MTSAPVRDPIADHLLTPENAAFLFIDYQASQVAGVFSMDRALLVKNAVSTVRTIKTFAVPVVHSTINVATGRGKPTLPELASLVSSFCRRNSSSCMSQNRPCRAAASAAAAAAMAWGWIWVSGVGSWWTSGIAG